MDSMLNVLLISWLGLTVMFYVLLFIAGVVIGVVLMRRWYKRPVPPGYEFLSAAINFLEEELSRTDDVVSQLWVKAELPDHQRNAATNRDTVYQEDKSWAESLKKFFRINTNAKMSEEFHPLSQRLRSIKIKLGRLRKNIEYAATRLSHTKPGSEDIKEDPFVKDEKAESDTVEGQTQADDTIRDLFDFHTSQAADREADAHQHYYNSYPQEEFISSGQPDTGRFTAANIPSEIIEFYNRAVTDMFAREHFRERYQPLRVGTVNAVERRQNPTIEAEYKETTDGDFFAFLIHGKNEYAVVPRLGLTIDAVCYNAGALGRVFKTQPFEPGLLYSRYCVRRPATFTRDGNRWELRLPGELDLGPSD